MPPKRAAAGMKKKKPNLLVFYVTLAAVVATMAYGLYRLDPPDWERIDIDREGVVGEPSGLALHPDRGTLFVVGDEGVLAEMTTQGKVVRRTALGGDLEGVAVDPDRSVLYVLDEGGVCLLVADWNDLSLKETIDLKPILARGGVSPDSGIGLEGVAYQPGKGGEGALWIATQRDPVRLFRLSVEDSPFRVRLDGFHDASLSEISDLTVDPKTGLLMALSDEEDRLASLTQEGKVLLSKPIPGANQEGVALSPNGDLFIAEDSGGVFRYPGGRTP